MCEFRVKGRPGSRDKPETLPCLKADADEADEDTTCPMGLRAKICSMTMTMTKTMTMLMTMGMTTILEIKYSYSKFHVDLFAPIEKLFKALHADEIPPY